MNPKCLGRSIPDTFSARSADSTGLEMRRITRGVSLDHLVGAGGERGRYFHPEDFCGLQIEDEFEFGGLLDRQICRLCAFENAPRIHADLTVYVGDIRAIAHQPARLRPFAV